MQNPTIGAVVIAVVALIILILFQQKFITKNKILKLIPGPLLVVLAGILLNEVFKIYEKIYKIETSDAHHLAKTLEKDLGNWIHKKESYVNPRTA